MVVGLNQSSRDQLALSLYYKTTTISVIRENDCFVYDVTCVCGEEEAQAHLCRNTY